MSARKALRPFTYLYPTPVVLVTSVDETGKPNIITLAWTGVVCSKPPQVAISINPKRYSNGLIKKTNEFVVNIPTEQIVRETDYCGIVSGRRKDKFNETKLTPMESKMIKPPLIGQCPVSLECKVKNIKALGSHDLFIGEIINVDVDKNVLNSSNRIDYGKLKPITFNPITGEYHSLGKRLGKIGFSKK